MIFVRLQGDKIEAHNSTIETEPLRYQSVIKWKKPQSVA